MSWVAIKHDGVEILFNNQPFRHRLTVGGEEKAGYWATRTIEEDDLNFAVVSVDCDDYDKMYITELGIPLPKGSIKKLIGRELTWEDEPVELTKSLTNKTE